MPTAYCFKYWEPTSKGNNVIRRIVGLAALAISATALVILPASPAPASPGACAGNGTATLGAGLYYPAPIGNGPRTTGFQFSFTAGVCMHGGTLGLTATATGTVTGNCGSSTGTGTLQGHSFSFTSAGSVLVLAGQVTGVVNAVPDALAGHSCLKPGPGASRFLVTGEVNLTP